MYLLYGTFAVSFQCRDTVGLVKRRAWCLYETFVTYSKRILFENKYGNKPMGSG